MLVNKKPFAEEKRVLPEYPRTFHLPHNPNTEKNDLVASEDDCRIIFESNVFVQEKVDGSNCGMALLAGEAVIRNREFILRKGYKKDTPAKKQFASVFTWFYENKKKFEKLDEGLSVFGEWMIAQHGIEYDKLPDWFIAYDLYDYERHVFVNPKESTKILQDAGFATVPMLYEGKIESYAQLEDLAKGASPFTTKEPREGIYLKVADEWKVTHRFKMVRPDFIRGAKWSHEELHKNTVRSEPA